MKISSTIIAVIIVVPVIGFGLGPLLPNSNGQLQMLAIVLSAPAALFLVVMFTPWLDWMAHLPHKKKDNMKPAKQYLSENLPFGLPIPSALEHAINEARKELIKEIAAKISIKQNFISTVVLKEEILLMLNDIK